VLRAQQRGAEKGTEQRRRELEKIQLKKLKLEDQLEELRAPGTAPLEAEPVAPSEPEPEPEPEVPLEPEPAVADELE
jgi:hypothetical protein